MTMNVHPQSQEGFALGKSELYDKARPKYNEEVLSRIRDTVGLCDKLRVVEIGCGSGLFTRAMLEHWSPSLEAVRCYDPNEGMLKVFQDVVRDPRVYVAKGVFEATDVEDGWADLVVAASAFHWCLDLESAAKEFVRILKPGGTICFLWNNTDRDIPWVRDMFTLAFEKPKGIPGHDFRAWEKFFELPTYKDNFHKPEGFVVKYIVDSTLELETKKALTWSAVATLDEGGKQAAKEKIKAIIEKGEGLVWVDKEEGTFEAPHSVPIIVMKRKNEAEVEN